MSDISISYCICVHNEADELKRLLTQLVSTIESNDEIVIQGDQGKVTDEVVSVLHKFLKDNRIKYIEYPLNKDFASFKNHLLNNCSKEYIFLIDADEYLSDTLALNVKALIEDNPHIDVFAVPRINTVDGITDEYVNQMGWKKVEINGLEVINPYDYQIRLFKNQPSIKYHGKVHEQIKGYSFLTALPTDTFDWCLFHPKTFERQTKQNQFYEQL